ncbi:protease complex subunit PrcB family protein, partial [Candidatus Bathyarchaeota archaeon]|nr:protease complex subunit PrcB family protein [Candidatus Bathyarchaeota archaeon]
MKTTIWITIISVILIATVLGSIFYFHSLPDPTQLDSLEVNSLKVLADGQVTFNISQKNDETRVIEAIVVNGERYSWSHGSQENSTILKGETKEWSIDIGSINEDEEIQLVVETNSGPISANATVGAPTTNTTTPTNSNYIYDYYGGIDLFSEGIHVIATNQDPRTLSSEFTSVNDYWKMLSENKTTRATDQDFISIIFSRGKKPTGGYEIQIKNFAWMESYPVKFLFQINFTDPGDDVMVTEALTNPLVLVPIGKLTSGQYNIEAS